MKGLRQRFNVADLPAHIGEGGEALIIPNPKVWPGKVLKLFLDPDDPDFTGDRQAAVVKLFEIQTKLHRFPKNLPVRVVVPLQTVPDPDAPTWKKIVGYLMREVENATQLKRYGQKPYLDSLGIPPADILNTVILPVFRDLHHTVSRLHEHEAGIVIGDFSDTNILVQGNIAFLCDADSFGFGKYPARLRKPELSDPLLSEKKKEPSPDSDWYSYTLLLLQSLLRIKPYEGRYTPKKMIKPADRVRERLSIFHKDVELPKWASTPRVLPDRLYEHFEEVFGRSDKRGPFPAYLLDMQWVQCQTCGTVHARVRCPVCPSYPGGLWLIDGLAGGKVQNWWNWGVKINGTTEKGEVRATPLFKREDCYIWSVTYRGRQLRYVYAVNGEYKREDGSTNDIVQAGVKMYRRSSASGRFKPMCEYTVFEDLGTGDEKPYVVIDDPQDDEIKGFYARKVIYNSHGLYAMREGQYVSLDKKGKHRSSSPDIVELTKNWFLPAGIGTSFDADWAVGETFGMVRLEGPGYMVPYYLFDAHDLQKKTAIKCTAIKGSALSWSCEFGRDLCWFFVSMREGVTITNHCMLIRRSGKVVFHVTVEAGTEDWLGDIERKCALGQSLLSPTNAGIVQTTLVGKKLQTMKHPDTKGFVDAQTLLIAGDDAIFAVKEHEIVQLQWKNMTDGSVGIDLLDLKERSKQQTILARRRKRIGRLSPEEIEKASTEERNKLWKDMDQRKK